MISFGNHYQLGEYEAGFSTLSLIPINYNLTDDETIELNNYIALYTFKNRIRESGRTIAELNEAEVNQLLTIAEASEGLSSVMVQGILCFFYDVCTEVRGTGYEVEGTRYEVRGRRYEV